ncbi:MAG: GNAT family N-acetyltransferase [Candidatus Aenigmatarchaeota archaeon]
MKFNYTIRKLTKKHLENPQQRRDFFNTLKNLRQVGSLTQTDAKRILTKINSQNGHIFIAQTYDEQIIGTVTLLIEQKFIQRGGKCGHIEDVSIMKGCEKRGVGSALVKKAVAAAIKSGCYKVILDCSDFNLPFYKNLGFYRYENHMKFDLNKKLKKK